MPQREAKVKKNNKKMLPVNIDKNTIIAIITIFIAILVAILSLIYVAAKFEGKISEKLDNNSDNLRLIISLISPVSQYIPKEGNLNSVIGRINKINDKKTSVNQKYVLIDKKYNDFSICLINESFEDWTRFGKVPYIGDFILIENIHMEYPLTAKCMVLNFFNDYENRDRMLLVSNKVFYRLVYDEDESLSESENNLLVKIRELKKNEWQTDKECIELRELLN
jgi:hypothetical protein